MTRSSACSPFVGVDQDAVGQHLDAVADALQLRRDLLVAVGAEAHLEHLAARVLADQRRGRALGHDPALVDDDEPIAELLGLVHVVRREQQRRAALLEPEQPVPQDVARLRVEARWSARRAAGCAGR